MSIQQGSMGCTERKALERLSELKESNRTGTGAKTLSEKREVTRQQERQYERENITFATVFGEYIESAQGNKNDRTNKNERLYFNKWIAPVLGRLPMRDISLRLLEDLKKTMVNAGKAARTIAYILSIVR
jgi:hypothetical protein